MAIAHPIKIFVIFYLHNQIFKPNHTVMSTRINVYLTFKGNCEEAMNFYKECLGGVLTIHRVNGSAIETHCPPEIKDQIMHANLIKDNLVLMGSDMLWPGDLVNGNSVTLSLNCSSEEEINEFFSKLAEGGQITDPLKDQFWGALFGTLTDKFGVKWMLNYDKTADA